MISYVFLIDLQVNLKKSNGEQILAGTNLAFRYSVLLGSHDKNTIITYDKSSKQDEMH